MSPVGLSASAAAGFPRIAVIKGRLTALSGWRLWAVQGGLGVLAALALPPLYLLPLLIPAFVCLLWLIEESAGPVKAFVGGWWFGFGHAAAGLSWIGFAFTVDAPRYGWMAPIAVAGMAMAVAFFPAVAAGLSRWVFAKRSLSPGGRILVFAALWTCLEWIRGWAFTGFPWNLMGTVWVALDAMIQVTALTGVYGLSLLTVAAAASPAVLAANGGGRGLVLPVVLAFGVLALVGAGGMVRLAGAGNETAAGVRLRLVQPNIPQHLKWRPDLRRAHVQKQIKMSLEPVNAGLPPTHVIWAETSVPYDVAETPGLLAALGAAAPKDGLIIVGSLRQNSGGAGPRKVWNSLHVVDPQGRIKAVYDKSHLVPFGEYIPFRGFLSKSLFASLVKNRRDISPGPDLRTLALDGLPAFSPLICYEVIFPGRVVDSRNRPNWLLNLTNDAWFGQSSGPYQHFAASRLRAVEEGLPLVRVANTGISGVIDPYGRIVKRLGLGQAGIIDSPLPEALEGLTLFARFGNWMTALILVMALVMGLVLPQATMGKPGS
ncbi:MAG: apolipoprotein N-acyltransferase [Rhodospirillales bacterium]|nr:apolipoprotein N-acyltransferase [Rhodospirillales bacterium]